VPGVCFSTAAEVRSEFQAMAAMVIPWVDLGMDQYLLIPFLDIFSGMNIHLPAILM
jgi:hypothetical protein